MSKPFHATMKDLGADHPHDFLATFDPATTEPTRPINVDLSTITTAADVVIGLGDPLREIVHIDFQASADRVKGADVLVYNALLYRQYRVPVHSLLVLLTAAFVLTGLRIKRTQAQQVFAGVRAMRESDIFMAIIEEGRETQTRLLIRRLAKRTLGEPDEQTITRLESITAIAHLERIFDRASEAGSWQDLLDTP